MTVFTLRSRRALAPSQLPAQWSRERLNLNSSISGASAHSRSPASSARPLRYCRAGVGINGRSAACETVSSTVLLSGDSGMLSCLRFRVDGGIGCLYHPTDSWSAISCLLLFFSSRRRNERPHALHRLRSPSAHVASSASCQCRTRRRAAPTWTHGHTVCFFECAQDDGRGQRRLLRFLLRRRLPSRNAAVGFCSGGVVVVG